MQNMFKNFTFQTFSFIHISQSGFTDITNHTHLNSICTTKTTISIYHIKALTSKNNYAIIS